ncbi:hypothetical protein [Actinocrispum sp. NPDC049592]|uniref:hypothetical protein n=1 Tax=Actinocrispum sp. NPDC049592 TaxID=3154835 RepID=UPI00341B8999
MVAELRMGLDDLGKPIDRSELPHRAGELRRGLGVERTRLEDVRDPVGDSRVLPARAP